MRKYLLVLILIPMWGLMLQLSCKPQPEEAPAKTERVAMKMEHVRKPAVAGTFYPTDPSRLKKQVEDFLNQATKSKLAGEIVALISPHAGYVYSGQVAAYAYKLLEGLKFEAVVVIAPSHYFPFKGASVYYQGGYELPLGVIPVHEQLAAQIMAKAGTIDFYPQAHAREHSLEVQLPFLQTVLGNFKLVPIVMGSQDMASCRTLAKAIADTIKGRRVLIVASSDLSHFHDYDKAVALDRTVQDRVANFDPEGLAQDLASGVNEACGGGPIITALLAARLLGADKTKVLKYANSGDVTGDLSRVVGYMSAVVYKSSSAADKAETPKAESSQGLTPAEKQELHRIARTTIEKLVRGEAPPRFTPLTPALREKRGAFVTLKKHGRLRGCIGYIQAIKPLYLTIEEMAKAAAFNDPRFPSLTAAELADVEIEISALTPLHKINDIKEIEVGKHGIYIKQGLHSGLLLPQVATDNHWDRLTFLKQTCGKAGLAPDAWQDKDTEIYIFSADIF